ncbi:Uncharacterised protein [Salmonella enterica subsp. enterica serovar Typhi]|nr:Uncharacterised protein [Salmonella enterica subsp. enterica serovar Typhi]CHZ63229.1 Uncharacterised protein [Salmonella enterica subsp. enterica serovar Typhi]
MFTRTTIIPAIVSPLTNFIAPSIAPRKRLSCWTCCLNVRAWSASITPARKSPSILICLPGIPSSEKRALTSATLSIPFVMTINCTIVMMVNTTNPTVRFPPTTNLPKASTILPALCCNSTSRDVLIVSDKRYNVVISNKDGNTDKSRGSLR